MKKTELILIRHGEVDNQKQILYGRLPGFGLTDLGKKQVKETAVKLKKLPVSVIYTSPLLRARQSALIVGKHIGIKPKVLFTLIEIKMIFQGISLSRYKNEIQPFQFDVKYVKKGQESVEDIARRMMYFVSLVKDKHRGKTVIAVSHGDPIVILKSVLDEKEFTWQYKKNNYLKTGDFIKFTLS